MNYNMGHVGIGDLAISLKSGVIAGGGSLALEWNYRNSCNG